MDTIIFAVPLHNLLIGYLQDRSVGRVGEPRRCGVVRAVVERGWRRVYSRRPASRRSVSHSQQYGGSTLLRIVADARRRGALSRPRFRQTYVLPLPHHYLHPLPLTLPTTSVRCQLFTNSFEKYRNKNYIKYFLQSLEKAYLLIL